MGLFPFMTETNFSYVYYILDKPVIEPVEFIDHPLPLALG